MTTSPDERLLAVNGGEKRVGLAVGSRSAGLAAPLRIVERKPGPRGLAELIGELARVADEESVNRILVGLPLNMDGSEGPAAAGARRLGRALEEAAGRPVILVDERLTSEAAQERARQSGWTPRSGRPIDHIAAAVLLQAWFDDERALQAREAALRDREPAREAEGKE